MQSDRVFAVFTLALVGGLAILLTLLFQSENAIVPTPVGFIEHIAISLSFRFAYKWIGGSDASEWIPAFITDGDIGGAVADGAQAAA